MAADEEFDSLLDNVYEDDLNTVTHTRGSTARAAPTARGRGRRRRRGGGNERLADENGTAEEEGGENDESTRAKRRLILRELTPVDFVGRNNASNAIAETVHELAFINAIWNRDHCTMNNSVPAKVRRELLQSVAAEKWVNNPDRRKQLSRWAAPLDTTLPLRTLPDDQGDVYVQNDYAGDVMRSFQLTSDASKPLHIPSTAWSTACFPRNETDASYDAFFNEGPNGGREGCVESVLFRIDNVEDVNSGEVNPDLMNFMYLLSLALCKDDSQHMFYGVQTEFTDIMTRKNKNVHICNVRQRAPSRIEAVRATQRLSACETLDEHLRRKLTLYKHQFDMECEGINVLPINDIVHQEHGVAMTLFDADDTPQLSNPDSLVCSSQWTNDPAIAGHDLSDVDNQPETFTSSGPPCRIFYTVHVVPGIGSNGETVKYYMQTVTVRGTVIGVDPLVAIRQACKMFEDIGPTLLRIGKHMCDMMQTTNHDFIDRLFSTGSVFNCVNIFEPANLLEAVFRRAARDHVTNIHFKGHRLNLNDASELDDWNSFKAAIIEERKEYYDKIKQKTDLVLAQRSGFEMSREPDTTFAPVVYTGAHARLVNEKTLNALRKKAIHELRRRGWQEFFEDHYDERREDEDMNDHLRELKEQFVADHADGTPWHAETESQLSHYELTKTAMLCHTDDNGMKTFAFPVAGPLNLTGPGTVVFEFNMQSQIPFDKKTGVEIKKELLPDSPFMFNPLASIYVEQHLHMDRFDNYWDLKCEHVPTINHLLDQDFELPQHLLVMRMQIVDAMAFVAKRHDQSQTLRITQVEELVGASVRGGRTVRMVLDEIHKGAALGTMMRQRELLLKTWISNERRRMCTSDLRHMGTHLQIVNDLKTQGIKSSAMWMRCAADNNTHIQKQGCAHRFASDSARANELWSAGMYKLDHGLCTMNVALLLTFINGVSSYFSRNDKAAVGYPILLSDCGMQVTQAEITAFGLKTSVVQKKSSGAGADLLLLVGTTIQQAYPTNIPFPVALRSYMVQRDNQAKNLKKVSQLAWRQIGNVAVWRDDSGIIKNMTRSQCSKIGQISAMTETMKMQSNNEGGGNTFGRAEQAVGNPLQRAVGPQEEAWSTTQNLSNQNLETLYNGIPLFLLAGNRPDGQFPPSALEGGRLKPCFAAVQDHHGKMKVFRNQPNPAVQALAAASASDWNSSFIDPAHKDTEVKIANKDMTEQNVVMLAAMWATQPFSYIKSAMRLDYETRTDNLRTSMQNVIQNFMMLSPGLRRGETAGDMNRKTDVYIRVMTEGAFSTVDVPGLHSQQQLLLAFQRRAELPCIDHNGNIVLNLEAAFEDSLLAMLDIPVSMNTILSALYLSMTTYLLNVNVMIASCFFLFCTRCVTHCPLHVFATAAHGLELDKKEEEQLHSSFRYFDRMCHSSGRPKGGTELLNMGWFGTQYTVEDVLLWLDFKQHEELRDDIIVFHNRNPVGHQRSTFALVQEHRFLGPPTSWGSTRNRNKGSMLSVKVSSMQELKLLFLAEMQKEVSHNQRKQEWQRSHTSSLSAQTIAYFVDTQHFWDTVGKGTRFPQTLRMSTDENDTPHIATQETSNFYCSLLNDMSNLYGFIEHVLQYFHLPRNTSRKELFERVFASQRTTCISGRGAGKQHVFPASPAWKEPIIPSTGEGYEPFKVELRPYVLSPQQSAPMPSGVHVVLGVDVLWLMLSQIYTGAWVQKTTAMCEIRVHLNNMGFAAQSLLGLFMCLQMELASVPVLSNNSITLFSPCSIHEQHLVKVPFNERLHIDFNEQDTTILDGGERVAANLFVNIASACRKSSAFTFVRCKDDSTVMAYANQIYTEKDVRVPEHERVLMPIVMEAVAHMNVVKYMQIFTARFHTAYPAVVDALVHRGNVQNIFILAMQLGGRSLNADFMLHLSLELTWSTTREEELPVMTLGDNTCVAVLKRRGNVFTLESMTVTATINCEAWDEVLRDNEAKPLTTLPLRTQVQWRIDELAVAQSRGVYFEDGFAHMRRPRDPLPQCTECVPMVIMPLCQHQALVCVQPNLTQIELWDTKMEQARFVTRVGVRELFHAHEPMRWTIQNSVKWLNDQVDIMPLARVDDEIHVVEFPDGTMQFWVFTAVTATAENDRRDRFFFNSRAHLKFALNKNQGLAISAEERTNWTHCPWLFGYDSYATLTQPNMFERAQRNRGSDVADCTFSVYKDDAYEQMLPVYQRALSQSTQLQQMQSGSIMNSTVSQSNARIRELRATLERTRATKEDLATLQVQVGGSETFGLGVADQEAREHSLGMLVHHTDAAQWLKDGHHRVSFAFRNNVYSNTIDWSSALMCMVREGHRLYMRVTDDVYRDIRNKVKNAQFPDPSQSHLVNVERGAVLLECYYVVGAASRTYYQTFDDLVVDVIIMIHKRQMGAQEEEHYDDRNSECKLFYQVQVKKNDQMMLSLRPLDGMQCAKHLVIKHARQRSWGHNEPHNNMDIEDDDDLMDIDSGQSTGVVYWE